jgi:hypothetical protein
MENWHWTRISELAGCREASSMFSAGLANWTAKDGNSDSSNTVFFLKTLVQTLLELQKRAEELDAVRSVVRHDGRNPNHDARTLVKFSLHRMTSAICLICGSPKKWRACISDSSASLHWAVLELHELVLVNTYLHYVTFKKHMIKFGRKKQVCAMSGGGHINQRPIYRTGITRAEPNWPKPINLVKILQFGGSQIFQMMESIHGRIVPESCAL